MDDRKIQNFMDRLQQNAKHRNVEMRRVIARMSEGDSGEMVRAVVEHVTEAMEMAMARHGATLPDDLIGDIVRAKFAAFEEITGRPFETVFMRSVALRGEIADAQGGGQCG